MRSVHPGFRLHAGVFLFGCVEANVVLAVVDLQRDGSDLVSIGSFVVPLLVHGQLVLEVFRVVTVFLFVWIALGRLLHGLLHHDYKLLLGPQNLGVPDGVRREHARRHRVDVRLSEVPAFRLDHGHGGHVG